MATLQDWIKVFGEPIIKGEIMKKAKILEKSKGTTQTGGIMYTFKLQTFDTDGTTKKPFTSRAFENEESDPEFIAALENVKEGQEAEVGFTKVGDYWNITSIIPCRDINEDIKESKKEALSGSAKDKEIRFLALCKIGGTMVSGNLHLFIDYAGGDFESGWIKARELVVDFAKDVSEAMDK